MTTTNHLGDEPNKFYIISVTVLTFVVPAICFSAEHFANDSSLTFELFSKWFIFSAVGLRLFLAGVKQVKNPAFTAKQIFILTVQTVFQFFVNWVSLIFVLDLLQLFHCLSRNGEL